MAFGYNLANKMLSLVLRVPLLPEQTPPHCLKGKKEKEQDPALGKDEESKI